MPPERLTIHLQTSEGVARVPLAAFRSAMDDVSGILHELEHEISDGRGTVSWDVADLRIGSVMATFAPSVGKDLPLAAVVIRDFVSGMRSLTESNRRPRHFTDTALEKSRHLCHLIGDKVAHISVASDEPGEQVYVTEYVAANVRTILEHMEYVGSLEGPLEVISARAENGLYFSIRDGVTGARVRCTFPEEMLERALDAFRKGVVVMGSIQCDSSGRPRSIRVMQLDVMPDQASLPQPEDVAGILKGALNGVPSGVFVRERFGD